MTPANMKENNSVVTYEKIGMTVIRMGEAFAKKSKGISELEEEEGVSEVERQQALSLYKLHL